jgi:dTDP-4-amino-4,6-dideoxygalactose transaminase
MLRNHGRKSKYVHEKVGFNLRFNEIQAAVGREQLKILDELNQGRRRAAEWYRRELAGVERVLLPPVDDPSMQSVYHLFVIRLDNADVREGLARALKEQGIESGIHYPIPNHQQKAVTDLFGPQPTLPRTEDYVKRILSLPIFPSMTEAEVKTVAEAVRNYLR